MRAVAVFVAVLAAALPAFGDCVAPFFAYQTPVTTGQDPQSIAVADFDKDGKLDLVTTSTTADNVSVFLGNGDGTFPVVVPTYAVGDGPTLVRVADFNNDTWPDIATLNTVGNSVSVLLNNGDGTFASAVTTTPGFNVVRFDAGNIDADHFADVAIATPTQIVILYGTGDGHFGATTTTLATNGAAQDLDLADFDGDGKLDVADTADAPSVLSKLEVWHNELPTGFTRTTYNPPNALSYRILAGDLTLDGKPDIAMTTNLGLVLYVNDGSGGMTFKAKIATNNSHKELAIGDVSEDGIPDVILPGPGNVSEFIWIWADGSIGGFGQNRLVPELGWTALAFGDFNHDGRYDYAAVAPDLNHFTVALNACTSRYVKLTIEVSANPSLYKDSVTAVVTVTPREPFMPTPTGTVTMNYGDGPKTLTPIPGSNSAQATFTLSGMPLGDNRTGPNYSGDSNYGAASLLHIQTVIRRPFSAPLDFIGFGASFPSQVHLAWTASAGVDHHEIWRLDGGVWSLLTTTTAETYDDTSVLPTKTYGYRVRSVAADNSMTAYTYPVIGTSYEGPSMPPFDPGFLIRSTHLDFVRTLTNQLRVTAGFAPMTFTDPNVLGLLIKAIHINELRASVNASRSTIGLPAWPYVQPTITGGGVSTVYSADIRDLWYATTRR